MFKILIVEDDYPIYIYIKKLIGSLTECEISYAEDGQQCLNALKKEKFDCIFMDISMPVMSGIEALTAIRNDAELNHMPVVMLSAISAKEEIVKVLQLKVFDYILKPVVKEDAVVRIKKFFDFINTQKNHDHNHSSGNPENGVNELCKSA